MSDYAWIITRDHLGEGDAGSRGPSDITVDQTAALRAGEGEDFRLFDDDGELYYSGRVIGEMADGDPLTDFGAPSEGCTYMSMKDKDGKWEIVIG